MPRLSDVWRLIEPLILTLRDAILSLFQTHPARLAVAGVLFIAAVFTGSVYVDRVQRYQDIVSTTVRSEMEETPQRFKVLEAFIMSTIDPQLAARIKKATLSAAFSERLDRLHSVLASNQLDPPSGLSLAKPDYAATQKPQEAILSDNAPSGFLFFPLNLLRGDTTAIYNKVLAEPADASESQALRDAVNADPFIADDIAASRQLVEVMKDFTQVPIFENDSSLQSLSAEVYPVQIYYITKNGLNRIVNNTDAREQKVIYRNMFRATTFFPSRPYFVEAFRLIRPGELKGLKGEAAASFYVSQPYLDIGGFGVVVTLARPVRYSNHSDAAICFDLLVRLQNPIAFQLKQRLYSFGATAQDVKCDIGLSGRVECSGQSDEIFPITQTLEARLRDAMNAGNLSTIAGDINILNDPRRPGDVSRAGVADLLTYPFELMFGYNAKPIDFAIPLTAPRAQSMNALTVEFLVSSLNLERFLQVTAALGLSSASMLLSAFFVIVLSWHRETRRRQTFEDAFTLVEGVLYGAPTPYCRLDSKDQVENCNIAFCELLKLPADQNSIRLLKGQTFESQLAARSKNTYHDVQQRRREGEKVPPYTLYFARRDGTEVETRITSGVIPGRLPNDLPSTFGIVIPMPNVPE